MTKNHNYNTPEKGATDWDVPINDNFTALDTDVEIRDTESNLGSYSPKSGAKFFATDTGTIYLGDGSQWNQAPTSGSEPVVYAPVGNVQSAIDSVHSSSRSMVKLVPGETYTPSSAWQIRSNVTLDCEGATVSPSADTDVFHVYDRAKLLNAEVDLTGFDTYSSNVILLSTAFNEEPFADSTRIDNVACVGAQTGTAQGTFVRLRTTGGKHISSFPISNLRVTDPKPSGGDRQTIGNGIVLENDGDFLNSVHFQNIYIRDPNRGIVITGSDGTVNYNMFCNTIIQPQDGNNSEVGWRIEKGKGNHLQGMIWDNQNWSDTGIRLTTTAGKDNNHVGLYSGVPVVNNSGNPFHQKAVYE